MYFPIQKRQTSQVYVDFFLKKLFLRQDTDSMFQGHTFVWKSDYWVG